jgi:hypothetical protein
MLPGIEEYCGARGASRGIWGASSGARGASCRALGASRGARGASCGARRASRGALGASRGTRKASHGAREASRSIHGVLEMTGGKSFTKLFTTPCHHLKAYLGCRWNPRLAVGRLHQWLDRAAQRSNQRIAQRQDRYRLSQRTQRSGRDPAHQRLKSSLPNINHRPACHRRRPHPNASGVHRAGRVFVGFIGEPTETLPIGKAGLPARLLHVNHS